MLIKLLKNIKLISKIKSFYNKNKENILDIIIFGSSVRGKEKPEDVDLLIIFKDEVILDLSYSLRKMIENFSYNVEIISKKYDEIFSPNFMARESILSEGISVIYNKSISEGLGYSNFILFKYNLKGFSKSNRMRFYYSLYGRDKKSGILNNLSLIKFSDTILISPIDKSELAKEFLENWKIEYLEIPILIPTRIIKIKIFKKS